MSLILETIKNHNSARLALVGDTQNYTYGDLQTEIKKRADELSDVTVLGLALDNGPDWILWDLAAIKTGIICIPLPPFFNKEQIAHAVTVSGISHILSPHGLRATGSPISKTMLQGTNKVTFTSGTTGTPKGVCLTQDGLEQVATSLVKVLGTKIAQRHVSVLPLAILLENVAGVYATLLAGGTIYAPSLKTTGFANPFQPDFTLLLKYMNQHKITSAILVPELLRGLINVKRSLPDLRFLAVGGSKISPSLIIAAREMGLPIYEGYGLSECGSVTALNTPAKDKIGSAGTILPHIQLGVKNGEIVIKNPPFLGYLGSPHKGAFPTGDLGEIDQNGFLHIDGRKKNILITSFGRNIAPEWIRGVLLAQPEILNAEIYGDAQPFLSADITPASPHSNIEQAIKRANKELPNYAHIKDFKIITQEKNDELLQSTG